MSRYIDADELYSRVKTKTNPYGKPTLDYESGVKVLDMIKNTHTADVVPKSEVESIFDELIKQAGEIAENYKKEADGMSVSEFARIEYRGTQIGALLVQYKIAELKKKYTEGKQ